MTSRKSNGEDSIYWDKSKERYIGAISLGHFPDGRRNRPKVSGKTKAEVRAKLRKKRQEAEAGVKSRAAYSIEKAVRAWLAHGLKGRDKGSIETYTRMATNHVIADLGKAKLVDLTSEAVDCWLDEKSMVLAKSSLEMILSILRRSISHAQRSDLVMRNVAELVELPDGQPGRPSKSLTLEQAESALAARKGTWIHVYVAVSLLVGIRTEEVRPLTWDRVHLYPEGGFSPHIEVWRSVRRRGETKTQKSRRTLGLPQGLVELLAEHRATQQARREGLGLPWDPGGFVFGTDVGEQRTADHVRRNFRALLRDAGFPAPTQWTPRELRHSFVSILSDRGIPMEKIAQLVGHSSTRVTETVYRHQIRPVITEGAEAMDEIFFRDADVRE
ncbi:tyrosine-type recombinase/integrase [Streptomyces sp. NPDC059080]|uniref:tyrosine-type recombinase/integrase n=1 Tax=Streptomyces sp. NPDC059080 TaxID=3346718 RepID=UPI0036CDC323